MRSGSIATVAAVVLLVTAGCSAPLAGSDSATTSRGSPATEGVDVTTTSEAAATPTTEPPTATATPTPKSEPSVAVENGSLPANATRTFRRLRAITGTDVDSPRRVVVVNDSAALLPFGGGEDGGDATLHGTARFQRLLGVGPEPGDVNGSMENGVTLGNGAIRLYPGPTPTRAAVEPLLAHEYVHYVQVASDQQLAVTRQFGPTRTTDETYATRSVLEGAAVYVETVYVRRHLPNATTGAVRTDRLYGRLTPGSTGRYSQSWYYFGRRYVRSRVDSPTDLDVVYESPPTTSEQVLHGHAPGAEPPANLSVTVRDGDSPWRGTPSDTLGEAFVRVALENGVSPDRAARGAAGWGTDRLVTFTPRDGTEASYAWVLRWDDAANATEFAETLSASLDARGNRTGGGWTADGTAFDVYRPSDRVVVLAVGDESFVSDLTVLGSGGAVTVRP